MAQFEGPSKNKTKSAHFILQPFHKSTFNTQLICYSQVAQHSTAEDFTQSQDCCVHLTLRWDGATYNKGRLIEVWNRRKKIETFSNSWGWSCRTSYFAQVFCKATGLADIIGPARRVVWGDMSPLFSSGVWSGRCFLWKEPVGSFGDYIPSLFVH